ncbi:aliphatic sulfonate ABC transporter substrate-binding protein [Streptomyces sp. MAR4 CNX-425]|uniref:aliphatic sulfonate ABC transporter substrate-binding protein n=1 Tax=Streptomyces sp. MAR4 CNX-425 TaxID=3406343 RepID=UPI003B503187
MRATRRTLALSLTVALISLPVAACSDDGGGGSDGSSVRFGYINDYNGASLLAIAEKQGLWKKAGIDADVSVFNNGPIQIQALGAGDLDFGYIGPGAMWLPASGKADVVAINTLGYADRVIAQPGITSLADLKGKKVGVPEGTSGDMALGLALQEEGMSIDDVEKVPMDPATIVSAFSSGQIDGAGLWYPMIDEIKAKVPDLEEVASTRDMKDSYFPTAFVAGTGVDPELSTKVVRVLQQANDWRFEHPEETVAQTAAMLKLDEEKVRADAANQEVLATEDLVAKTKDGTVGAWLDELAEFFVGTGQLQEAPDPAEYYLGDLYTKASTK